MSELVKEIFDGVKVEGRKYLLEHEAKTVCKQYKIPITKIKIAKTIKEAVDFHEEMDCPTVFKIISPDIIHKFDVGGITSLYRLKQS